jgi:hypothetical protein
MSPDPAPATAENTPAPPPQSAEPAATPASSPWTAGRLLAAACRLLVAVALGAAAAAKVSAPGAFLREIEAYFPFLTRPSAIAAGSMAVMIEAAVGVALLVGWQVRSSAGSAAGLLAVFCGLLLWRVSAEGWDGFSCACFGEWWVRSAPVALATDAALLAAALVAWRTAPRAEPLPTRWKTWAVVGAAALALPGGFAQLSLTVPPMALQEGEDLRRLSPPAELAAGEHLVAVINTGCPRCRGQWPNVAALSKEPGLPPMTVVFVNDELSAGIFRAQFRVTLPSLVAEEPLRSRLIDTKPPLILWVKSGRVRAIWSNWLPPAAVVRERLAAER